MKPIKLLILLLPGVLLLSCWEKEKYPTGVFPAEVANFREINSVYDDYNSDFPVIMYRQLFHFSSNRYSSGRNFDIIGDNMYINWDKTNGQLTIGTDLMDDAYKYTRALFDSINSSCNELGPYSVGFQEGFEEVTWTDVLLYASDCGGDYDIHFAIGEVVSNRDTVVTSISSPQQVRLVNTLANELYPTFFGEEFYYLDQYGPKTEKIEKLLYCSDREGNFDLYELNVPNNDNLAQWLGTGTTTSSVKLPISSAGNDKCPFVNGKLLVFVSDREGGFGGFDLYYSQYQDGSWTEPTNFGSTINSEFDEYRPVVLHYPEFKNNLLVFSSNRPGGLGGFDLYQTGIDLDIR